MTLRYTGFLPLSFRPRGVGYKKMYKMKAALLSLSLIFIMGCISAATVTRHELDNRISKHDVETVNWVSYMGTKDRYHYIFNGYTLGSNTYRIHENEFQIDDPFPLTQNRKKWRTLKKNWGIWSTKDMFDKLIENSQPINPTDVNTLSTD